MTIFYGSLETPDSEEVPMYSHIMSRYALPDSIAEQLEKHHIQARYYYRLV
jgi:hypothetical protein